MHVQYFPKSHKFIPGKKDEVFFWQRLTRINIDTIVSLFKNNALKIHIHKAVDPKQKFIQPKKADEDNFSMTYSNWFDTREEMWDVIKQKGIYIAPREYEGIGLSFLEAMSMGKAVIAADNPTMNEYIENGKTGYLFNLKKVSTIDLSNVEEVQKNTYQYMKDGYVKWNSDKKKIINFIKK
jgi:glycosyltransferase involved in cell wall biosynthesis